MTQKPEATASIQAMLEADPALLAQVQSSTDFSAAVEIIFKAAAAQGMDVGAPELVAQVKAAVATQTVVSDAELEKIAGGSYSLMAEAARNKHPERAGDLEEALYKVETMEQREQREIRMRLQSQIDQIERGLALSARGFSG